jgi:hypothetical protein
MQTTLHTLRPALLLASAALAAACGTGGGGAAAAAADLETNAGAYDPDAFGWTSPHGPGFHPLGTATKILDRESELALVATAPGAGSTSGRVFDLDSGVQSLTPWIEMTLGSDREIHALARGNVDHDGAEELVVAQELPFGTGFSVLGYDPDGQWVERGSTTIAISGVDHLALADVDGDHVDELLVVFDHTLYVRDDLDAGFADL